MLAPAAWELSASLNNSDSRYMNGETHIIYVQLEQTQLKLLTSQRTDDTDL